MLIFEDFIVQSVALIGRRISSRLEAIIPYIRLGREKKGMLLAIIQLDSSGGEHAQLF